MTGNTDGFDHRTLQGAAPRRGKTARANTSEGAQPGAYTAFGLRAEAEPIRPGLHVVATPIGNLGDISFRALATLAAADAIVAEDTRVTKTLLAHYGIATPLVAYHEHNEYRGGFGSGRLGRARRAGGRGSAHRPVLF
jgi:hypothetical protein